MSGRRGTGGAGGAHRDDSSPPLVAGLPGDGLRNVLSVIDDELLLRCRPPLDLPLDEAWSEPTEPCRSIIRFVWT